MSAELDFAWKQFRQAVAALALPPDEQRRVTGPGCLACELLNDFDDGRRLFLANFGDVLTAEQLAPIAAIGALISEMPAADLECFNDEVVRRPIWQAVREKATEAQRVFGCAGETVTPFIETEPGVWRRSAPE